MKIKQLSVFIENKPGAVCYPCRVLAAADVDLSTLTLADTKDFGILRIIAEEWEKALDVLKKNSFAVSANDVLALEVEDSAGGLSELLDLISANGLNVEYMYAAVTACNGKAVMVFRFDDTDRAAEVLQKLPECRIVGPDRFFNLNNK